jgi:biotin transport system permease protein
MLGLCLVTMVLFFIENTQIQFVFLSVVICLYLSMGRDFFMLGVRQLRLLWPFVVVIFLWHSWTNEVREGLTILFRLVSVFALANFVTMTTRLTDMIEVFRKITSPLVRFGLKTSMVELSIALVIRLIPVLVIKGSGLTEAWRARSRRRTSWHIILPFTVLALDDAEQVAEALRARGGFTKLEND